MVWQQSESATHARLAVYGLGIIARKMRKNGEVEEASTILKQLLERLDQVTDPHEKRDVLRGISNTGDATALPAIRALLRDDTPAVRGGAVEALRLMETPEVDRLIADQLSPDAEPATGVRLSTIRAASTRSHEDPLLAALIEAATDDPDEKVKKEARKLLLSWSKDTPELTTVLEQIAEADETTAEKGGGE
jgi:hypothetical protein